MTYIIPGTSQHNDYILELEKENEALEQQVTALVGALEATKKFLDYSPEMPFELLAEAEELQVIVQQALALAEANKTG